MDNWYSNGIIYSLHLESFRDGNGDGVGDLIGLTDSLDYLASLGVTCLWLQPFFPSPMRDNGYDVSDYLGIDPRYGDLGDFVTLLERADRRNIKILLDLPLNHTSTQHHWFRSARSGPGSPYRDYYYWSEREPEVKSDVVIFEGEQERNWTFDEHAQAWYYHTFYPEQPDLNFTNTAVLEELEKTMAFWLRLGVAGFRLDAVPHMLRAKGGRSFPGDPHDVLRRFRRFTETQRRDVVLMGEVDTQPERYRDYFGREDQLNVLLNFYLSNYLFLALAKQEGAALNRVLEDLPMGLPFDQYGSFLRNHDELDLERLSEEDRQTVYREMAPREDMRIFGRGIRRRLGPILGGNQARIRLANSLLLTMPGIPIIRYGDEIGMGDDLSLPGRDSVRTSMQWNDHANAGFSAAPPENWARPLISEGAYGNERVNVADQRRDPDSLLNWFARAVRTRLELPEFGSGEPEHLETGDPTLFAHRCKQQGSCAIAVHNLSDQEKKVKLNLDREELDLALEMFADGHYEQMNQETGELEINPYGYRWFRIDPVTL